MKSRRIVSVKAGVTSQREMANQEPVHLCRGIVRIAQTYAGQGDMSYIKIPAVEDVSTWIRQA